MRPNLVYAKHNGSTIKHHVIFVIKATTLLLSEYSNLGAHSTLEFKNLFNNIDHGYRIPDRHLAGLGSL